MPARRAARLDGRLLLPRHARTWELVLTVVGPSGAEATTHPVLADGRPNMSVTLREQEFNSDRPGRTFDRFGHGRHAMSPEETARQHGLQAFEVPVDVADDRFQDRAAPKCIASTGGWPGGRANRKANRECNLAVATGSSSAPPPIRLDREGER